MPATDDDTLVAAARAGDRGAVERLLRGHYDRIHAVCRRITGNEADADDAAQEALLSIVRGLPRFDGRSSFATWVYRIATNASLDELRRRRRRPLLDAVGGHDHDSRRGGLDRRADPSPAAGGDGVAEQLADRMLLGAALGELAEEFRVAVVLRDVADLDYAEIAAVLAVPVGTVKSRIARGRAHLAAALHDTASEPARNQSGPGTRQTAAAESTPLT